MRNLQQELDSGKTYYQILGISRDANEKQIKQAYRKTSREFHPDTAKFKFMQDHKHLSETELNRQWDQQLEVAKVSFVAASLAYEILSSDIKATYDMLLDKARTKEDFIRVNKEADERNKDRIYQQAAEQAKEADQQAAEQARDAAQKARDGGIASLMEQFLKRFQHYTCVLGDKDKFIISINTSDKEKNLPSLFILSRLLDALSCDYNMDEEKVNIILENDDHNFDNIKMLFPQACLNIEFNQLKNYKDKGKNFLGEKILGFIINDGFTDMNTLYNKLYEILGDDLLIEDNILSIIRQKLDTRFSLKGENNHEELADNLLNILDTKAELLNNRKENQAQSEVAVPIQQPEQPASQTITTDSFPRAQDENPPQQPEEITSQTITTDSFPLVYYDNPSLPQQPEEPTRRPNATGSSPREQDENPSLPQQPEAITSQTITTDSFPLVQDENPSPAEQPVERIRRPNAKDSFPLVKDENPSPPEQSQKPTRRSNATGSSRIVKDENPSFITKIMEAINTAIQWVKNLFTQAEDKNNKAQQPQQTQKNTQSQNVGPQQQPTQAIDLPIGKPRDFAERVMQDPSSSDERSIF